MRLSNSRYKNVIKIHCNYRPRLPEFVSSLPSKGNPNFALDEWLCVSSIAVSASIRNSLGDAFDNNGIRALSFISISAI